MTSPLQITYNPLPAGAEQRRSQRVLLKIPVEVSWVTDDCQPVQEHAETEVINAHGALLRMKTRRTIPLQLELNHPRTKQSARVRVVGIGAPASDGSARFAVELAIPSETFWGVSIPPIVKAS